MSAHINWIFQDFWEQRIRRSSKYRKEAIPLIQSFCISRDASQLCSPISTGFSLQNFPISFETPVKETNLEITFALRFANDVSELSQKSGRSESINCIVLKIIAPLFDNLLVSSKTLFKTWLIKNSNDWSNESFVVLWKNPMLARGKKGLPKIAYCAYSITKPLTKIWTKPFLEKHCEKFRFFRFRTVEIQFFSLIAIELCAGTRPLWYSMKLNCEPCSPDQFAPLILHLNCSWPSNLVLGRKQSIGLFCTVGSFRLW